MLSKTKSSSQGDTVSVCPDTASYPTTSITTKTCRQPCRSTKAAFPHEKQTMALAQPLPDAKLLKIYPNAVQSVRKEIVDTCASCCESRIAGIPERANGGAARQRQINTYQEQNVVSVDCFERITAGTAIAPGYPRAKHFPCDRLTAQNNIPSCTSRSPVEKNGFTHRSGAGLTRLRNEISMPWSWVILEAQQYKAWQKNVAGPQQARQHQTVNFRETNTQANQIQALEVSTFTTKRFPPHISTLHTFFSPEQGGGKNTSSSAPQDRQHQP